MRMNAKRLWFLIPFLVIILLLFPLVAQAAITDSQVIAILKESIAGVADMAKLAYCASGVAALC